MPMRTRPSNPPRGSSSVSKPKKPRLSKVEEDDVKLAEKVFGKRLKKELDRVAETAGKKGVTKSMHE